MIFFFTRCLFIEFRNLNDKYKCRWGFGHPSLILLNLIRVLLARHLLSKNSKQKAPINIPSTALPLNGVHKSQDGNRGLTPAALLDKCQVRLSLFVLHNYLIMQALVCIITTEQPLFYIQKRAHKLFVCSWLLCVHEPNCSLGCLQRWSEGLTSSRVAGYSVLGIDGPS